MFPWVYEFHWSPSHIIFLGLFFSVVVVVFSTVAMALLRSHRAIRQRKDEMILWHSEFEDLPALAKACRHEFTNDVKHRTCDNAFDCRSCAVHPVLLERSGQRIAANLEEQSILGFSMPTDRLYHRGHTWARKEEDGTFTVGLDDFATRLVGTPDATGLPEIGTQLRANGAAWHAGKSGAKLRILSPVDGKVVERGGPEMDWYLRVKVDDPVQATRHLLRGEEIRPWLMREMERLQRSLSTDGLGISLADGGELVSDIHMQYPDVDWDGVWGEMFLQA